MNNILVFRIGHLGDTVITLPSFWRIRESFPKAKITLLTNFDLRNPGYLSPKSVLPEKGLYDDLLSYPVGGTALTQVRALVSLFANLRKKKFEALFYLPPRTRTARQVRRDILFFRWAGISKIFGTTSIKKYRLPITSPPDAEPVVSESAYLLECVEEAFSEVAPANFRTDLLLTDEERSTSLDWLERRLCSNISESRPIAVAPGSKWSSKIWNEDRFVKVVKELINYKNIFPIVFGGREDREKGERLIDHWGKGVNACGELTVRQSAALLERCELYLGNDTGTMHLAAAVGVKCVAIFAAIDLEGRWVPFGTGHRIFRSKVECQHCHTPDCFNYHKCLELIETDAVIKASLSILDRKP